MFLFFEDINTPVIFTIIFFFIVYGIIRHFDTEESLTFTDKVLISLGVSISIVMVYGYMRYEPDVLLTSGYWDK